jgi:cyclase
MLVQVRQRIKQLIAAGRTMDEVVAAGPTKAFDAKWGSGYATPDVFTKIVFSSLMKSSSRQ